MVYQPPVGARDLLPLDVAQKRWIEDRLQQIFHRWGYHRIITSTLERLDTLMAGGAVQPSTVIQIQNGDDEALGLRPELTASIARAAVTRMAGATYPQRLYYNANVFRQGNRGIQNRQREYYQAGVELLGVGGVAADAEILLLLWDGLRSLNLGQWYVVLGDAGLTRSLLSEFPVGMQAQVREAIAHLDRMALEALPLTPQQRDRALALLDLRGKPSDVLQRVSILDLTPDQRQTVNQLKMLLELLEQTVDTTSLVLDLSLIQTFDYYTGIVFEVVSSSESGKRVLGQGGRYDQLLGLYHPQSEMIPGIGFVLNIEDLHQVLLPTGQLPAETPASSWLIAPTNKAAWGAAFAYAQTIRESTTLVRVEVDLVERSSPDETRRYAQHRRMAHIAWVTLDSAPTIEPVAAGSNA